MAQTDTDIREAADAMGDLSRASQALYMAHLSAVRAGQATDAAQVEALQEAVMTAAQNLIDICHVVAVSETEILMKLISE